jgi:hypothetical protein
VASKIQLRRDNAANWTSVNPVLADGEVGYEKDTGQQKVGDGVTDWNALPYSAAGGGTAPTQQYVKTVGATGKDFTTFDEAMEWYLGLTHSGWGSGTSAAGIPVVIKLTAGESFSTAKEWTISNGPSLEIVTDTEYTPVTLSYANTGQLFHLYDAHLRMNEINLVKTGGSSGAATFWIYGSLLELWETAMDQGTDHFLSAFQGSHVEILNWSGTLNGWMEFYQSQLQLDVETWVSSSTSQTALQLYDSVADIPYVADCTGEPGASRSWAYAYNSRVRQRDVLYLTNFSTAIYARAGGQWSDQWGDGLDLTNVATAYDPPLNVASGDGSWITDGSLTFSPAAHTHTASEVSDSTAAGRSMLTAVDAAAQRTLLNVEDNAAADQSAAEVQVAATPANYTKGTDFVEGHLSGIDTALGDAIKEGETITDWGMAKATIGGTSPSWTWDWDNGHLSELTLTADATITISSTKGHANAEAKLILHSAGFIPTFVFTGCTVYPPNGGHDWTTSGTYMVNFSKVSTALYVVEQLMGTGV